MCKTILVILLTTLLSGCLGLPTIDPVPTTAPTKVLSTPTRMPEAGNTAITVQITGDVNVRDMQDVVRGWLHAGQPVSAVCSMDWCTVVGGAFHGMRFWRGCSSDNPERKSCQAR